MTSVYWTLDQQAEDTAPDLFMGSLPYMAPEQCMSKKLDGRSDIYSLAVVLFQLIASQLKRPQCQDHK